MKKFGLLSVLMNSAGVTTPGGGGGASAGTGGGNGSAGEGDSSTALVPAGNTGVSAPSGGDTSVATGDEGGSVATVPGGGSFRAIESGRLSKPAAEGFKALETHNPGLRWLSNVAQKALVFRDQMLGMFPGKNPVTEIQAMQREFKTLGGVKGIEAIRAELADVEENDLLYADGDPKLLMKMTHTPDKNGKWVPSPPAQEAFVKMIPHALKLFEQISPNRFSSYLAKAFLQHMKTAQMNDQGDTFDVALSLRRMASVLPKTKEQATPENLAIMHQIVGQELPILQAYIALLQGYTQLPPEELIPKEDAGLTSEREKLQRERIDLRNSVWRRDRDAIKNKLALSEYDRQAAGMKVSARQKEEIFAKFDDRLETARRYTTDYRSTVESFSDNNDRDGFLSFHRELFIAKIPGLMARVIKDELGDVKPKATTTSVASAATTQTQRTETAARMTAVKSFPATNGSDLKRGPGGTTTEMIGKRQGIASKKNQWGVPEGTLVSWVNAPRP